MENSVKHLVEVWKDHIHSPPLIHQAGHLVIQGSEDTCYENACAGEQAAQDQTKGKSFLLLHLQPCNTLMCAGISVWASVCKIGWFFLHPGRGCEPQAEGQGKIRSEEC